MKEQITETEKQIIETQTPEEEVTGVLNDNRGVGVVEVILILVVIFTINMGCK